MNKVNLNGILHKNMDILFVPLNPPDISNGNGHYFSRVKTFWDILYDSGLIKEKITDLLSADNLVFRANGINFLNSIYGIHDLIDTVETDSQKVKPKRSDVLKILSIINENQPKIVCLMHNKVRKAFIKTLQIDGFKIVNCIYGELGTYNNSILFSLPFPTGSSISKAVITDYYTSLKMLLESIYT